MSRFEKPHQHPYRATEELGEWLTILKAHGVEAAIEGFSPYYPGPSFLMVMWRMEDEDVAEEYLRLMDKLPADWTKKTNSWERLARRHVSMEDNPKSRVGKASRPRPYLG